MPAKIFISHSCKDFQLQPADRQDPEKLARWRRLEFARLVRNKIVEGLGRAQPDGMGYKVLLDRDRLEPGDNWQAKLHVWLGTCEGAVLLLSEDSICSDWVRKEATVLSWRKSLRPELLLVPVFLGDLDANALRTRGLECLKLNDIQAIRLDPTDIPGGGSKVESLSDDAERDAHATCLAQKVLDAFRDLSAMNIDKEVQMWIQGVAARLQEAKPYFLDLARKELQVHDNDWNDDEDYMMVHDLLGRTAILAHQLLNSELARLRPAMNALRQGVTKETFEWLATRVASQWVDIRAAQMLLPGARPQYLQPDESRLLLLNAAYVETSQAYINRAHCCSLPDNRVMIVAKPVGEDFHQELLKHIEKNLFGKLNLPGKLRNLDASRSESKPELLRSRENIIAGILKDMPFYVVLDMDEEWQLSQDQLEGVRMARKNITYLFLTGGSSFANTPLSNQNLEYLMPELTQAREDEGLILNSVL